MQCVTWKCGSRRPLPCRPAWVEMESTWRRQGDSNNVPSIVEGTNILGHEWLSFSTHWMYFTLAARSRDHSFHQHREDPRVLRPASIAQVTPSCAFLLSHPKIQTEASMSP